MFDVVTAKGVSCISRTYVERIAALHEAFQAGGERTTSAETLAGAGYIVADGNPHDLQFEPKPCFATDNLEALWRRRSQLKHRSDGLVFTPVNEPIRTGTHWSLYKWKEVNSIDLRVAGRREPSGDWTMRLYGGDAAREEDISVFVCGDKELRFAVSHTDLLNEIIQSEEADVSGEFSKILECQCQVRGDNVICEPLKLRPDKSSPNNRITIARTLVNIQENITFDELAQAVLRRAPERTSYSIPSPQAGILSTDTC